MKRLQSLVALSSVALTATVGASAFAYDFGEWYGPCNPNHPPTPPYAAPEALVHEVYPLRWSWIHWWEANRERFFVKASQGGLHQSGQSSEADLYRTGHAALIEALADETPAVRRAAIIALGRLGAVADREVIQVAASSDPSPDVREAALIALGMFSDDASIAYLRDADYATDALRRSALTAMGLIDTLPESLFEQLQGLVSSGQPADVSVALWSLTLHADTTHLPALQGLVEREDSPWVVSDALVALGATGDPRVQGMLQQVLLTHDRQIRNSPLSSLAAWRRLYDRQVHLEREIREVRKRKARENYLHARYRWDQQRWHEWADTPNPPPSRAQRQTTPVVFVKGIERIHYARLRTCVRSRIIQVAADEP